MRALSALRSTAAGLAGVLALGASGLALAPAPASASTTLQPLRIALDFTPNVDYLGIYAAINKGYFTQQGIKPVIIPYTGTPAETLLQTGKTDLGLTYPPDIPQYRESGLKYRAVAGVTSDNTIAIAVLKSSHYKHLSQLNGTLYGGFGVPSDPPIIKALFSKVGVAHPDFKQVVLQSTAYQALADGRVAYTTVFGGIDDVTAELQGVKLREFFLKDYLGANTYNFPDDVYVASDSAIADKASLLRHGLKALSEGYTFAAHNPAQAEQILVQDNETALAGQKNITTATGNATAAHFLNSSGQWGPLSASDFAGVTTILAQAHQFKGAPPAPADDYTNSLLPGGS